MAAELIPTEDSKGVMDVIAVQPYSIDFHREDDGTARPIYFDIDGQPKYLNEERFWYVPIDSPPDDPFGRAPAAPVIGEVMFSLQLLNDLKRAAHAVAWGRVDVSVLFDALTAACPVELRSDPERFPLWMNARLDDIRQAYSQIQPDDAFVHFDFAKVTAVNAAGATLQVAPMIRLLELRTIRALKQLPILMGSNEGTTETHGSVQFEIYVKGIETLRKRTSFLLEKALEAALNLLGYQAAIRVVWERVRTTDQLADAQAEAAEIANEIAKRDQGWIDQDAASMAVTGHKSVKDPPPTLAETVQKADEAVQATADAQAAQVAAAAQAAEAKTAADAQVAAAVAATAAADQQEGQLPLPSVNIDATSTTADSEGGSAAGRGAGSWVEPTHPPALAWLPASLVIAAEVTNGTGPLPNSNGRGPRVNGGGNHAR